MADINNTIQSEVVDWDGLVYYDSKIKEFINNKTTDIESTVADLAATVASAVTQEDLAIFDRRLDVLAETVAAHEAAINALKEDRDDLEAAVLVLQEDDKQINQGLADIRVRLENVVLEEDIANFVTKDTLTAELQEVSDNISSDISVLTEAVAEIQSNVDELATTEELTKVTEHITTIETTLQTEYVKTEEVTNIVTKEVTETIDRELEEKVAQVVVEKVEQGELKIPAERLTYGEF